MARQYGKRKKNQIITLYGFEEWVEALQKAVDVDVDKATEQCFEECSKIVDDALEEKMQKANVPQSLRAKKSVYKDRRGNVYVFSDGWLKSDEEAFLKVCYLNYGTPKRATKAGGQRVQINGEWVTLKANRGKISPRYFITNAKRAAAQKVKKVQKNTLEEIMKGVKP